MSTNFYIERIAIGVLFILGGILSIVGGVWALTTWLEYLPELAEQSEQNEILFIFKKFHLVFLTGAITILAGILIFFRRPLGWAFGISMSVYRIYILVISIYKALDPSSIGNGTDLAETRPLFITLFIVLVLLFLLSFVFFLLPKIRSDFKTTRTHYLTALGLILLVFFDRMFI